ncbi:MAG TPA: nucleoside-triphosphatase [Dysgonamonadaceae bacterium]|nr:nucleoside-triphosphatase [Dysgonamonadaceae bacterium]HPD43485.1 nucleoside-triphosphatase [Dysgonamonadaceae bacterium]
MPTKTTLNEQWIKASIIGSMWASVEIVWGSFLHNLRVPLSGHILTAIGLIILISASYRWKEKGLFWRAGIICALLKTMSPSAVIFGPMIAIFSEALLLEASVRLFGKNRIGLIIGAILAMSWNLVQAIISKIIAYGYNLVKLYESIMLYAQKQLHTDIDLVWAPIVLLLVVYVLLGLGTAIAGIFIGQRLESSDLKPRMFAEKNNNNLPFAAKYSQFPFATAWLIFDILAIVAVLTTANFIPLEFWFGLSIAIVASWIMHYKSALRRLAQPRLWISFFIITVIAAVSFSRFQGNISLWEGALIGLEMNVRAIVVVIGFSVIGTELYSPKVKKIFQRESLVSLYTALDLSVESLPNMIALVPNLKKIFSNPIDIVRNFLSYAEYRMHEIEARQHQLASIAIVTGEKGSGKTRFMSETATELKKRGFDVGGVYTRKIIDNGEITAYSAVNISNCEERSLLKKDNEDMGLRIGAFSIDPEGLEFGRKAIAHASQANLLMIDEIGKLELDGGGWYDELRSLPLEKELFIILSVRLEFLYDVIHKWNLYPSVIYNVSESKPEKLISEIESYFEYEK